MFKGSITALITPFKNGTVDWDAFHDLIEAQIEGGTHGLVLCGTTAESPVLSCEEHESIVERGIAAVKGGIPVIIGTGTNNTVTTIEKTVHAREAGADAVLVVTPYYNKPTQEGLYAHYRAVAKSAAVPLIIYNIPGRCVVDMLPETMARLAQIDNIVGVKDATGDLSRVRQMRNLLDKEFCQLSGEDAMIHDFMKEGGDGCISVTSNIAPALCADFHNLWQQGKFAEAAAVHERLMPLHKALFVESSPAPAKYAAARLGYCTDEMRLPLLPASPMARDAVDAAMLDCGLISAQGQPILRAHG